MGIYISGVKGLPEQVQENKNKIKEVEEQIEGIDFDAIRELQDQVAENTQDINNLEASIGVQNQAINGLKDRADALERTTQLMSYNDDLSMTDFRNSIEVADDVYARNVRVEGDGSIVNTTQSGMHFKEGANDDTLTIANNDGATPHYLHFNADGTLDIDGQPVGGGSTLYEHNIGVVYASTTLKLCLLSDRSTAYSTIGQIAKYLNGKGLNAASKQHVASGAYVENQQACIVIGAYASSTTELDFYSFNLTTQGTSAIPLNSATVFDIFYQL